MGLIDVDGALPNFTKCSTWKDIKESHASTKLVELHIHDVYGMLILLFVGLTISVVGSAAEKAVGKKFKPKGQGSMSSTEMEAEKTVHTADNIMPGQAE